MSSLFSIIIKLDKVSYRSIWLAIFIYSTLLGLLLQFIVLPNIIPQIHAGEGLISGGDWVGYHQIAKNLSLKINSFGWKEWELKPYGQTAAGIASIFYTLIVPKPFILVPVYAAILATSSIILVVISNNLLNDKFSAIISVIPFVVFPSNIMIYNQIGKDALYFLGVYFCLYSWILIFKNENSLKKLIISLIFFSVGSFFMWTVRQYSISILTYTIYLLIALSSLQYISNIRSNTLHYKKYIITLFIFIFSLFILKVFPIDSTDARGTLVTEEIIFETDSAIPENKKFNYKISDQVNTEWHGIKFAREKWQKSVLLPTKIDDMFLNIGILRNGYLLDYSIRKEIYKDTGSNIDVEVHLTSVVDFFNYTPRALQIGLLAPFPSDWFRNFNIAQGVSSLRYIFAIEMLISYVCLLAFPFVIFRLWSNPFFYITLLFSLGMLLLYAFATPNIGTLYRLRYGFIMPLITISLGFAISRLIIFYKLRQP